MQTTRLNGPGESSTAADFAIARPTTAKDIGSSSSSASPAATRRIGSEVPYLPPSRVDQRAAIGITTERSAPTRLEEVPYQCSVLPKVLRSETCGWTTVSVLPRTAETSSSVAWTCRSGWISAVLLKTVGPPVKDRAWSVQQRGAHPEEVVKHRFELGVDCVVVQYSKMEHN